jgi:hypothetical protein
VSRVGCWELPSVSTSIAVATIRVNVHCLGVFWKPCVEQEVGGVRSVVASFCLRKGGEQIVKGHVVQRRRGD